MYPELKPSYQWSAQMDEGDIWASKQMQKHTWENERMNLIRRWERLKNQSSWWEDTLRDTEPKLPDSPKPSQRAIEEPKQASRLSEGKRIINKRRTKLYHQKCIDSSIRQKDWWHYHYELFKAARPFQSEVFERCMTFFEQFQNQGVSPFAEEHLKGTSPFFCENGTGAGWNTCKCQINNLCSG